MVQQAFDRQEGYPGRFSDMAGAGDTEMDRRDYCQ